MCIDGGYYISIHSFKKLITLSTFQFFWPKKVPFLFVYYVWALGGRLLWTWFHRPILTSVHWAQVERCQILGTKQNKTKTLPSGIRNLLDREQMGDPLRCPFPHSSQAWSDFLPKSNKSCSWFGLLSGLKFETQFQSLQGGMRSLAVAHSAAITIASLLLGCILWAMCGLLFNPEMVVKLTTLNWVTAYCLAKFFYRTDCLVCVYSCETHKGGCDP